MQILVVEDEILVRRGTVMTLKELDPQASVAQASSLQSAFKMLEATLQTDLIFLDLELPDSEGLDTLGRLHDWCERKDVKARVVVLSATEDPALISKALEAHAAGFIVKRVLSEENYSDALSYSMRGKVWVPPATVFQHVPKAARTHTPLGTKGKYPACLSKREKEVCDLIRNGRSYQAIAAKLSPSPRTGKRPTDETVRRHVINIANKLDVEGRPLVGVMVALHVLEISSRDPDDGA